MNELFPEFKKGIEHLIEDEEGNITGKKLLVLGTLVIILGRILTPSIFAAHRSHSSHRSHRSHSSHQSGHSSGHSSHESHESHSSHTSSTHESHSNHSNHSSHASHTSHANTSSHSNSRFSEEGDVKYAPDVEDIPGVSTKAVKVSKSEFKLPDVNQHFEDPKMTPISDLIPMAAAPLPTYDVMINSGPIQIPPNTDQVD